MTAPAPERVAFVGPRQGLSPDQERGLRRVLNGWRGNGSDELHHQGDLTGLDGALVAKEIGFWVVSHPVAGERTYPHRAGVNDELDDPVLPDVRDDRLLALCGRVLGAAPGPQFWDRVPVWQFLARAHAAGRELVVVGMNGEEQDVHWPTGGVR